MAEDNPITILELQNKRYEQERTIERISLLSDLLTEAMSNGKLEVLNFATYFNAKYKDRK